MYIKFALKKYFFFYSALFFLFMFSLFSSCSAIKIGISQIVDHPALNVTRQGIMDSLSKGNDVSVIYENAQGNASLASQIAHKFVGQGVQVIIAIGTTSAKAAIASAQNAGIPVVFASITDPVGSSLVRNPQAPEGSVTGSSNHTNPLLQVKMIQEILPDLSRLGMIYNPGEDNSVAIMREMVEAGKKIGVTVLAVTAGTTRDVADAARNLAAKVDAFIISNDNTALAAFESVVRIAQEAEKPVPVFTEETDMIERGALAALGCDQYEVGLTAGEMVLKILAGTKVARLPVSYPSKTRLYINNSLAKKIGVDVPAALLSKAEKVF